MPETAINTPFEAGEIIDIACAEFRKRLLGLSPLQGSKEYAAFSIDFSHKIRLRRAGEQDHEVRETLAWANIERGGLLALDSLDALEEGHSIPNTVMLAESSTFKSQDPNEERLDRDMPLTIETGDGRGGKLRKKVKVKV